NHRSLRALKRFQLVHDEQTFHLATIIIFLLILCSFINHIINGDKQDINDEIVFAYVTALSQQLLWIKYNQFLRTQYLNMSESNCITYNTKFQMGGTRRHMCKRCSDQFDEFETRLNLSDKGNRK
ncbi:unnamed protein product, partial [Rotaria sp. Silwood2]